MQPVIPYPLRSRPAFRSRTWSRTDLVAPLLALWVLVLFARFGDDYSGDDFALLSLFADRPPLHFLRVSSSPPGPRRLRLPDRRAPGRCLAALLPVGLVLGRRLAVAFHISNLLFHWIATLLVYRLARELAGLAAAGACLAAALFAVLPIHVETVGWISGRADSVPAIFSMATLLAYARWRRSASRLAYAAALICCVGALYSKQSAVILPVVLAAYDLQIERLNLRTSWRTALPWLAFLLLTGGYLLERRLLFSSVLREETLSITTLAQLVPLQLAHLTMLLTGTGELLPQVALSNNLLALLSGRALAGLGLLLVALAAVVVFRLRDLERGPASRLRATFGYFGFSWWVLNTAPLLVTYPSPRHLYLAGAGFAICLAQMLTLPRRGFAGRAALVGALLLVSGYALFVQRGLQAWNVATAVSAVARRDLQREVLDAPPGGRLSRSLPPRAPTAGFPPGSGAGRCPSCCGRRSRIRS